jgi:hypothetical protein
VRRGEEMSGEERRGEEMRGEERRGAERRGEERKVVHGVLLDQNPVFDFPLPIACNMPFPSHLPAC